MSRVPVGARIAPVVLVVAFGLAATGALMAERAIAKAEYSQARLGTAQIAASLDAFIRHYSAELRVLHPVVVGLDQSSAPDGDVAGLRLLLKQQIATPAFDAVWTADSTGVLQLVVSLPGFDPPPAGTDLWTMMQSGGSRSVDPTTLRVELGRTSVASSQANVLLFIESLVGLQSNTRFLVGAVSLDTLRAVLVRSARDRALLIEVESPAGPVLSLSENRSVLGSGEIREVVSIPGNKLWTVAASYPHSSRGTRVILWGLSFIALVGLGVGLLLERREGRRIADRSTELEHLSTELLRANRAKSEFLANVSHELRTPLNAIVGFVDLLRDGVYGELNARQIGPVERIEASANHLRHLVDQVLDLAKMAAGRLEVHTEPIDLRPFVFDVASEVEPLVTEKGLALSLAVGATLPRVRSDPTHLRQILVNLLGNAVKFTSTGGISVRGRLVQADGPDSRSAHGHGSVTLRAPSARPGGVWVALQVGDTGIGIAEKDRERIFEEFEQVDAGPRGDSIRRGTGLGLSISRRLARLLGGDVTVESEVGRGSVFTVWLPVDPADLRDGQAA